MEGLLDQAELKRSVRTCQRQMARRVSDDEKLSTILGQLVSLTRSSGGFIVDTSEVGTKGQVTVLARQLPPRGSDDYGFWERVGRRRIPVGELSALLDEEHFSEMFSFPIHRDGALTGMIVLEGRSDGYPQALFHELSPLIQPALSVLESMALRVERFALQAETDPDSAPASAANSQDRRVLNRLVAREIQAASLRGGSVSVCWLDLDDFAKFNQSHGEEAGDRVLCQIASRLRQSVRKEDIVAAAGGDEFVIVLKDTDAPAFYQRVMDAFGQPVDGVKGNARISASMGVSVYPDDPSDSETLLRHAEQALYQAKEEGRGRHRVFDFKKFRVIEERSAFLREIERALDNREFELFLQPKINLEERTVEGFEGLIRWNHPERGRLTPDQFLPLIEATPLEEQLGNYVLHAGMELLNLFQKQGGGYGLSVNLSPAHFLGERFLQDMDALLSRYPTVLRGRLTLEILETTAWGDQDAAARVVRQCKQLGVSMALDDFGTGFSSLSYFRKLPLDEIKIDKSFVMDMEQQPEDEVIVESIIALSKRFGRRVVAEGIESEAVAKKLAELGCDVAQGYFFSRPLPVSEALSFASSFECSVHTKVTC
ncbi:bifunctional diguanylate cyclase/phosphodiesterase [Marinobacter sp. BW6]|uniref:putative bifunctional diguanylate cyclase/phosphodiesterase n=1 Tax=Marinobacter sp. BW6 TaxID=2592624 RepID=UPI001F08183B|nr:bifunctional diguanylate cyclase/phosphodiesterase [Marinobacter sp. BW6]